MGDRLTAGQPYVTSQLGSAFRPSEVGKSSTGLSCWGYGGVYHLCHLSRVVTTTTIFISHRNIEDNIKCMTGCQVGRSPSIVAAYNYCVSIIL